MTENRISGYLYNKHFSESNEEKCTTFQTMAWQYFIRILLKTAQLLSKHFPYLSLSLFVSFISFFIKRRILLQFLSQFLNVCNSSRIPQPSVQPLVYVFLTFFRFYNFSNNFHLSKNLLRNKCFHWRLCFFIFLLPCRQELAVYLWSEII